MAPQSRPLVSIGMPVYNGQNFLEQAIDCFAVQTLRDFELIVSDNFSTDRTAEICQRYAAKDSRIRYYRSPENRGLAWNYNRVLELAKGKYFKWAAHDDLCAPTFLELCVNVLERSPQVVLAHTQVTVIDEHGAPLRHYGRVCHLDAPRPSRRLRDLFASARGLSNPLFGIIRKSGLRSAPFGSYVSSDLVLLAELALHGQFYEVPERLFLRRDHPQKSDRANVTLDDVASLYDPANRGKIHMRNWRLLGGYLAAIHREPMDLGERASCYLFMTRWSMWNSRYLAKELVDAAIQLRSRRSSLGPRSDRQVS